VFQFILFFNWVEYAPVKYGDYEYPIWADAVGWVIGVFPVCIIIIMGACKLSTAPEGSLSEVCQHITQFL
jgi:solute carrier family 6 amino acid transporter-like protein 5/7/9/14